MNNISIDNAGITRIQQTIKSIYYSYNIMHIIYIILKASDLP